MSGNTLKTIFLSLFLPLTAAASKPTPVTFGFGAVQCERTRTVLCLADDDYPSAHCTSDVQRVVAAINDAAGRELLSFGGMVSPDGARQAFEKGAIIITAAHFPDPNLGGYTAAPLQVIDGQVCVGRTLIMLAQEVARSDSLDRVYLLCHEMLHAIGGRHPMLDPREPYYISRLDPALNLTTGLTDLLSYGDKLAIRVTYGDR